MIHLSYEQEITLIKRLVMAQGVSEEDAASLAAVVTHSDFTGTYSHGLSRLCIYLRQYMAGALVAQPNFRCVKDTDASLAFDCGGGSLSAHASMALPPVWAVTVQISAAAAITATAWQGTT